MTVPPLDLTSSAQNESASPGTRWMRWPYLSDGLRASRMAGTMKAGMGSCRALFRVPSVWDEERLLLAAGIPEIVDEK